MSGCLLTRSVSGFACSTNSLINVSPPREVRAVAPIVRENRHATLSESLCCVRAVVISLLSVQTGCADRPGSATESSREGRTWEFNRRDRRAQTRAHADASCVGRTSSNPNSDNRQGAFMRPWVQQTAKPVLLGVSLGAAGAASGKQVRSSISIPASACGAGAAVFCDSMVGYRIVRPRPTQGRSPARTLRRPPGVPAFHVLPALAALPGMGESPNLAIPPGLTVPCAPAMSAHWRRGTACGPSMRADIAAHGPVPQGRSTPCRPSRPGREVCPVREPASRSA